MTMKKTLIASAVMAGIFTAPAAFALRSIRQVSLSP